MELPADAEALLKGRVRLIKWACSLETRVLRNWSLASLWRPINGPVETWPLALCDGRTVSQSSLVEADRIRRKYTGGTTWVLEEPGLEWFLFQWADQWWSRYSQVLWLSRGRYAMYASPALTSNHTHWPGRRCSALFLLAVYCWVECQGSQKHRCKGYGLHTC